MLFQFLIGRLGTPRRDPIEDQKMRFQFLIGRLGTLLHGSSIPFFFGFQFLIGRLGTQDEPGGLGSSQDVSIPHR